MAARGWRVAIDNLSIHGGAAEIQGDLTIDTDASLVLEERAAADAAEAGKGKLWVRSDTPNVLVFTDDAGTDTDLGGGGDVVDDTTPQLGGQLDVNGFALGDGTLELLKFSETASAVNELTITNAAAAGAPSLSATGDDTDIDLDLVPKGTGMITTDAPIVTTSYLQSTSTGSEALLLTSPGIIKWNSNLNTFKSDGSIFTFTAGGVNAAEIAQGFTVFNQAANVNQDFRIESVSDPEIFFVDAGTNKIGISTQSAQSLFEIRGPTGSGAASAAVLTLATKETTVVAADQLGRIDFNAPDEADGSDAILVAASVYAEASDTFSATVNATDLVFATGASEAATEKCRIGANGNFGLGTAAFGTSAVGVLTIANGTQGSALANAIQIVSEDLSAGNTILSIQTEGAGAVAAGTPASADGAIAIKVNGTVRYLTYSDTAPS